eukprot:5474585-Ditylum_brightwellii.AAC.1
MIDIMQKLQGFAYMTALDLNMGYHTICLDLDAQKICTIILPWDKIKHLSYWIAREGVKPPEKEVQAILSLNPPKNVKQTRNLLGIVQYYRDILGKYSHILAPLTELTKEPKDKRRDLNLSGARHNKPLSVLKGYLAGTYV